MGCTESRISKNDISKKRKDIDDLKEDCKRGIRRIKSVPYDMYKMEIELPNQQSPCKGHTRIEPISDKYWAFNLNM